MPKNKTDFVTLLHDIQYMQKIDPVQADNIAIANADYSLPGIVTKTGLTIRKYLGLKFNDDKHYEIGDLAMNFIMKSPQYSKLFTKYNVDPQDYI
jgi:hypothetical protein